MKIQIENFARDIEYTTQEEMPDSFPLTIVSGGCPLYGYLLKPGGVKEELRPCVIMFHGFPGYTTNNDLEYALMRMGCVVIHVNHRGAWGSEGNYLFSNLVDDAVSIAKWASNPATSAKYHIDSQAIFLVGHSMGGMTVLNAAGRLPFIRGVAAIAPYDLAACFTKGFEAELFEMIEGEGRCLRMTSAGEVYENAQAHYQELSIENTYTHLKDQDVLLIGAQLDHVAPPDRMIQPIYEKLHTYPGKGSCRYEILHTNHGLCGQRTVLARKIGEWIAHILSQ